MSRRRQGSRASRPHRESHFAVDVPMIRLNPDASLRPSSPPPLPHGFTYGAEGIFAPICQDFPARSPPPQNARRSGPATRQAPATAPSAKISIGIISLVTCMSSMDAGIAPVLISSVHNSRDAPPFARGREHQATREERGGFVRRGGGAVRKASRNRRREGESGEDRLRPQTAEPDGLDGGGRLHALLVVEAPHLVHGRRCECGRGCKAEKEKEGQGWIYALVMPCTQKITTGYVPGYG